VSEGSPTERFGPYIVYEQLGIGGMAQVHRAVVADSGVHRPVALKRMLSHIAGSEDMVKSFVREARLASYLRHENVAQTYDLGRVGDTYFIVMELITGRNLREVLRHCGATTGPMPVPIALNILNQICDALDYAHNLCDETGEPLGIIHRDVSPSNIIVSDSGVVKLIDFGIAKASGAGMQTMSGTLKGKFAYMAPEYLAGRIDARADLFAVGVIAHELLTNRPLFAGRDDIDTLTRVRDMHIAPPSAKNPQVPPEIDDIVMTALARDPERRWQHATALRSALTTLTRRLDLVASNAQVIQWLDWAFSQRRRRPGSDGDTEADPRTDPQPTNEEPSISIDQGAADLAAMSGRITLVKGGDPEPPTKTPLGTPAYVPAQHVLPATHAANAMAPPMVRSSAAFPRAPSQPPTAASATRTAQPMPSMVSAPRASQPIPAAPPYRPSPPSQPPPIAAPHRPSPPSQPPPIAAPHRPSPPSQPPPIAAPHRPSPPSQPPPIAAQAASALFALPALPPAPPHATLLGGASAPVPNRSAGPFAAQRQRLPSQVPGVPSSTADPTQSARIRRDFAQRTFRPTQPPPLPRDRFSHLMPVLLVVLAAAAAATTVYFVLPLLT
jgi:serine/threonine protein kinase